MIIDCIGARDPLGTDKRVYVNSFLSAVFAESVQIASVRFLLSPDDFPHANPGLLNFETGKIKLFTISDSVTNHLSTPAFDDLASDYVHLVRCPSPGRAQQRQEYSASSHISTLVQIAGTEEYGSRALSTAGIAKSQPGLHGRQPIMAYGPHASEERHEEIEYRLLTESRPLDVPYSNLLIFSSWLNALSVESALEALGSKHNSQYDLIASVGQLLRDQLHIECWALPLGSPFSFEASPRELLNFADNLQEAYSSPDQSDFGSKSIGTPARIAVLVSSADEPYASSWETILCSIAEETIYGHEVRLFVPHDIKDSHLYTLNCPEVEVHPLHGNSVQAWAPDICLTASESQLDISVMSLPYTHVSVPGADLGHMDWLAALPLESLLSKLTTQTRVEYC